MGDLGRIGGVEGVGVEVEVGRGGFREGGGGRFMEKGDQSCFFSTQTLKSEVVMCANCRVRECPFLVFVWFFS